MRSGTTNGALQTLNYEWNMACFAMAWSFDSYWVVLWAVRGEFQLKLESIFQKKQRDKEGSSFLIISSLWPSWFNCAFRCALCTTQRPWRTPLQRYSPEVVTASFFFLNSKGVIISSTNSLFGLGRGKKSFRPCQMCKEGRKQLQAPKLLFFCVHREIATRLTAKSSKSILSK